MTSIAETASAPAHQGAPGQTEHNTLYKVLTAQHTATATSWSWLPYLPTQNKDGTWTPGAWTPPATALAWCSRGYHGTTAPAELYGEGCLLYRCEVRGAEVRNGSDPKSCHEQMRLLAPATWDEGGVWTFGHHEIRAGKARASGSASVEAYDTASVEAYDTASVRAYDTASVRAYDTASVEAYDTASVRAYDTASVEAYDTASVRAYDTASVRAYDTASVEASGSASVEAYDTASVEAYDTASVRASGSASVEASGSASVVSTPYHLAGAQIALQGMAAHIDRRGGKLVLRGA